MRIIHTRRRTHGRLNSAHTHTHTSLWCFCILSKQRTHASARARVYSFARRRAFLLLWCWRREREPHQPEYNVKRICIIDARSSYTERHTLMKRAEPRFHNVIVASHSLAAANSSIALLQVLWLRAWCNTLFCANFVYSLSFEFTWTETPRLLGGGKNGSMWIIAL